MSKRSLWCASLTERLVNESLVRPPLTLQRKQKVQEYLKESGWDSRVSIECIGSSATSAGDAMRELDQMGVIESDPFILISGDVVSNVDLKPYIQVQPFARPPPKPPP